MTEGHKALSPAHRAGATTGGAFSILERQMHQLTINTLTTITSREVAELTEKRHDHVLRDACQMLEDIGSPQTWGNLPDAYGRPQPVLLLDKEQSLCLVAGYSAPLRMAIIERWKRGLDSMLMA